ncbi:hypothetical protein ACTXT7_015651 [Hymenolepis weldensis]
MRGERREEIERKEEASVPSEDAPDCKEQEELVPDAGSYISGELDRNSIPIEHRISKILKSEDFKQSLSARIVSAHSKKDPKPHQNSDTSPQEGLKLDQSDLEEVYAECSRTNRIVKNCERFPLPTARRTQAAAFSNDLFEEASFLILLEI